MLILARNEEINKWLGENPAVLGGIFLVIGLALLAYGVSDLLTGKARGKWGTRVAQVACNLGLEEAFVQRPTYPAGPLDTRSILNSRVRLAHSRGWPRGFTGVAGSELERIRAGRVF